MSHLGDVLLLDGTEGTPTIRTTKLYCSVPAKHSHTQNTFVCISTALLTWDTSAPTTETTLSLSGYWRHEIWVWLIIKDKKDKKEGGKRIIFRYAFTKHLKLS